MAGISSETSGNEPAARSHRDGIAIAAFPVVMSAGLLATYAGFAVLGLPHTVAGFLSVLLFGFAAVPLLERLSPFRSHWNRSDQDVATDCWHLVIANGIIPNLERPLLAAFLIGATGWAAATFGGSTWPHQWPLLAQLALMLVIAEFGRYWIHVAAHKVPFLWRLHAVHHSPNRLYFLNAARFHPIEKVLFQLPEVVPFIILGTNVETLALYFTFNSIHGLFQHSNIRLRLGPLNYVFSMTELHRWHHSKAIGESDTNFGNNLILWDLIFGTYFNPKEREVGEIGLLNPAYPKGYLGQLAAPFADRDVSKPVGWVPGSR